jgi:hypothetical protein
MCKSLVTHKAKLQNASDSNDFVRIASTARARDDCEQVADMLEFGLTESDDDDDADESMLVSNITNSRFCHTTLTISTYFYYQGPTPSGVYLKSVRSLARNCSISCTGKNFLTLKLCGNLLKILRMLLGRFVSFGHSKDNLVLTLSSLLYLRGMSVS